MNESAYILDSFRKWVWPETLFEDSDPSTILSMETIAEILRDFTQKFLYLGQDFQGIVRELYGEMKLQECLFYLNQLSERN